MDWPESVAEYEKFIVPLTEGTGGVNPLIHYADAAIGGLKGMLLNQEALAAANVGLQAERDAAKEACCHGCYTDWLKVIDLRKELAQAEAEVERLKDLMGLLFMDYAELGLGTDDFGEWLADLDRRWKERER